jgi:hypothetical protein
VVVELLSALGVATGVVDLAPTRWAIESRVRGHVRLEPENRREPMLATGLVEVDDAVEIAVVGDADCLLAVSLGGEHQVLDARGPVEH